MLIPRFLVHSDILYFDLYNITLRGKSVRSWCDGSSDRSFMLDPLSYFSFQPVLLDWCNKGGGMCYPVYGIMNIKEPHTANQKE